jgi:hypothetical protein
LTAETYSDRILGMSGTRTVPATAVQVFTGNNIIARADLASRSLSVRLTLDRPDPENRAYRHPDPLAWTEANRGRILSATYTILRGNPRLRCQNPQEAETRFKCWWHVVGSAVEYAAELHADWCGQRQQRLGPESPAHQPTKIKFRDRFLIGEAEEEQTCSLATVLDVLRSRWPTGCKAADVAAYAGTANEGAIEFKAALEQATGKQLSVITSTTITWRLKALADVPVLVGGRVLALRYAPDAEHGGRFAVKDVR